MAYREPDHNFLGLEIYKKGIQKTRRRVERAGLSNVRLLRAEAKATLPKLFGPGEVKEVYINFPDPWPKKRHSRRRLIKSDFIQTLYQVLALHGRVYLATDWLDYSREMLQFFQDHEGFKNVVEGDFLSQAPGGRPVTKYEQTFLQEGRPIYYLIFEKLAFGKL
jgi:tRNA (guanine-N7-)-methyltransferase